MSEITPQIKEELERFLKEDIGKGDITSALLPNGTITAEIITKEDTIIAGVTYARTMFELQNCESKILKSDGVKAHKGDTIMRISGKPQNVLACERTALNLLSRMSGIATATAEIVNRTSTSTRKIAKLYATRKTAPGLRIFDKIAVEIGGAKRHRMRLDESIMIKDNHIATVCTLDSRSPKHTTSSAIQHLIKKAKQKYKEIEVEVESSTDAIIAARAGATTIMIDNLSPFGVIETVRLLKKEGLRDSITIEASGKITKKNIGKYMKSGVDRISMGSITNSVKGVDLSLEVIQESS